MQVVGNDGESRCSWSYQPGKQSYYLSEHFEAQQIDSCLVIGMTS